jgi:GSH-dependent disulfide-bond oxidoreductase
LISLYTGNSPAGYKVTIMLEECGLPYKPFFPDLIAREHKQPLFLAMNPNGRIPVIIDHDAGDLTVWESSAIQIYLAEKIGRFLPTDPITRSSVMQWLMWQTAGLGPMQAQLNVFRHLFPERLPSVIGRYERETYRLYSVMEKQLGERRYIACESYTIADMLALGRLRRLVALVARSLSKFTTLVGGNRRAIGGSGWDDGSANRYPAGGRR